MKQATIFRSVILVGLSLAIFGECLDFFVPGILPPGLENAYAAHAEKETELMSALILGALALLIVVAGIAATLGLLLLKPWSRRIALWVTILSLALYPSLGPTLYSGWAFMLIEASMVLWGVALAMTYFSELKVHFEK